MSLKIIDGNADKPRRLVIPVCVTEDLKKELKYLAKKHHLRISNLVGQLLKYALANLE